MAAAWVERRLAAILAADVVGYSRLVEQDEADTLSALKTLRCGVIEPLLTEHHGRIVKLIGDGAIAEFSSVVDAVACAVAVQKRVAASQVSQPPERRIVFRMGVNLGDVVVEGDDLLGHGVNIAARLEQICEPGGVLISGPAYDQLQGKLNLPIEFAGEQRVKNIDRPIRTYRVRLDGVRAAPTLLHRPRRWTVSVAIALLLALALGAGLFLWLRLAEPMPVGRPSIAVLPFDNLSGDEATQRLADGVTEDIITDLARFREFDVIARASTAVYKGKPVDVRQIGRDLNVRYVLEGSVQRQGEQIRATAQLIDAGTAAHVWTQRWDRPAADLFAVQTEIAQQAAAQIGGWNAVIAAERRTSQRKRPEDLSAYELYLRGSDLLARGGKDNTEEAVRLFTQAVEKDPHLARAWTALSAAHDYTISFGADRNTATEQAKKAAERAVALDPADGDATGRWPKPSSAWATSRAPQRSTRRRCGSTRGTPTFWQLLGVQRAHWGSRSVGRNSSIKRCGSTRTAASVPLIGSGAPILLRGDTRMRCGPWRSSPWTGAPWADGCSVPPAMRRWDGWRKRAPRLRTPWPATPT
jgi:TolB-like protein/class 3 adenylate cyclase